MEIGRELAPGGELFDQVVKEYEEEAAMSNKPRNSAKGFW